MPAFSSKGTVSRRARRHSLRLELLEKRDLMAMYYVAPGVTNGGGDGTQASPFATIGAAVAAARLNPGLDEIQVASGSYNENVSISDPDGLVIRGDAINRPTINGTLPINLLTQTASFTFENLNLNSSSVSGLRVGNPNLPNTRRGSVTIRNVNASAASSANAYLPLHLTGVDQVTIENAVLTNGRLTLLDINRAIVSQVTVNQSRNEALFGNFVSELVVDGLNATLMPGNGIQLSNPIRTYSGVGTPPVNQQNLVTIRNSNVSRSNLNGLAADQNVSVTVTNSTFNDNLSYGIWATQAIVSLNGVETNRNAVGVNATRPGAFSGTAITANDNRFSGLNLSGNASVNIVGAQLLRNGWDGATIDSTSGAVSLTNVQASNNLLSGLNLTNPATTVSLNNVITNDNAQTGLSLRRTSTSARLASVSINGGQALRNGVATGFSGWELDAMQSLSITGFEASSNGRFGLNVFGGVQTAVSVTQSTFNQNSATPGAVVPGLQMLSLASGLTLDTVTASGNRFDGILVDNVTGAVVANGIVATNNRLTGMIVRNGTVPYASYLTVTGSTFSNNGRTGLFSSLMQGVTVRNSVANQNGPASTSTESIAAGLWIDRTGQDSVLIEDSQVTGTRLGVQSGAGILVGNTQGPATRFNRVSVNDTVTHPLTTTTFGAAIAVVGSPFGAEVFDSTFTGNRLLDATALRGVLYSASVMKVTGSQLIDNEGIAVDGASVTVTASTIANTLGTAVRAATASISRSTISGNTGTTTVGQGPTIIANSALVIDQSTITDNTPSPSVTARPAIVGGSGSVSLHNTVLAGNSADSQAFLNPSSTASTGYNFIAGAPLGWTGDASDSISDFNQPIDPMLEPLADNGGPTLTHRPATDSPLIDAGDPSISGFDQRGLSRPLGYVGQAIGVADIGAVELEPINHPPTVGLGSENVVGTEGSFLQLLGSYSDRDLNVISVTASLGDIQLNGDGTFVWSLTPTDNLSQLVTITAVDAYGIAAQASFYLAVFNAAPVLGQVNVSTDYLTRRATVSTSISDLGTADTHVVTINWGDGTTSEVAPQADGSVNASHQYEATVGAVNLSVQGIDDDSDVTGVVTRTINTAPSLELDASSVVGNEGQTVRLSGRVADNEQNVASVQASIGIVQLSADGSFMWSYQATDNLTETVQVTVTDSFGSTHTSSFDLQINNVAPTLGPTTVSLDPITRAVTIASNITDPGVNDAAKLIVLRNGVTTSYTPNANGAVQAVFTLSTAGQFAFQVSAIDKDAGQSATTPYAMTMPGFVLANRTLAVYGSDSVDSIQFLTPRKQPVVAVANVGGAQLQYTINSSLIDNITAYLGDGNDVWAGGNISFPQFVFGQNGNDQITTGSGADILVGGAGADVLRAGSGTDLLFGGSGADQLYGEGGGDVLVAGQYAQENVLSSLQQLRTSWTGSGTYQTRVNRLRSGVGLDPQGALVKLSLDQTLDDAVDQLFGGSDSDWYLTAVASEVRDATREEIRN